MMAPGEIGVVPLHSTTESLQRHKSKSSRTKPGNSPRIDDTSHMERPTRVSTNSAAAVPTKSSRPGPALRTNSSPTLPFSRVQPDLQTQNRESVASVASIKDDPFFRNYQTPQSVSLARELRSASHSSGARQDEMNGRKLNATSAQPKSVSGSGMENINIAVIGAAGVGKSTLIQRALGLRSTPTAVASSSKMSVDNVIYLVSLVELDLESFDFSPDSKFVRWPKQINGQIVPKMDGALILYDVMNRESILDVPQTLNALVHSQLPTILVSCKCDNPVNTRQVDTDSVEAACVTDVETVKTAANVPESARLCLGHVLRSIMAFRNVAANASESVAPRRRAASSANLESISDGADRPTSQQSKHSRASSEYSMLKSVATSSGTSRVGNAPPRPNPAGRSNLQQYSLPAGHTAPPLSAHPAFRNDHPVEVSDDSEAETRPPSSIDPRTQASSRGDESLLTSEDSDVVSLLRYSDDIPILQRNDDSFVDRPSKVAGFTFDELVDRLLSQSMSKADSNFSDIFLCLYRKFAAPGELFSAILARLEQVAGDNGVHYLTRTATQLRVITVIAKWIASYPGDFASAQTNQRMHAFIEQLSAEPAFAAAAQEMRGDLQRVVEDDDTGWARTDADIDSASDSVAGSNKLSLRGSGKFSTGDSSSKTSGSGIFNEDKSLLIEKRQRRPSEAASLSSNEAHSASDSAAPVFQTVEDYEVEAATMVPTRTLPLTKFRYHICMDTSDDDFADEITRIDWVMFSSIRVRDLVRDVSLSLEQKEKCKSLANVNRMIDHFNHVAKWVSNMILLRDKAKHRALMLEKFMKIALRLRQLNNYNGLAAIIAGINGSAVHRLAQTRALVPAECQKRFMRLELLMSTQKSHFAYRLAWENSSLPRIPFIPLHRRDLVSAEVGSRTFVGPNGDRINWKKFEILAEVILPIMRSQGTPYSNLEKHDIARELILDCRMPIDDEEIYQRSLQLESTSANVVDNNRKKFPWFQK